MVNLVMTEALRKALDKHLPGHAYTTHVPHTVLSQLPDLASLVRGTRLYHPPLQAPSQEALEKKAAFRAHMTQLEQSLAERDYQALLHDRSRTGPLLQQGHLAETAGDLKLMRNQLSTVANVALSIFTAALAAWYWLARLPVSQRVLASVASAMGLGLIEVFLYLRYVSKVEQAKEHDRRRSSKSRPKIKKEQ